MRFRCRITTAYLNISENINRGGQTENFRESIFINFIAFMDKIEVKYYRTLKTPPSDAYNA
jgi:hypothetical protein